LKYKDKSEPVAEPVALFRQFRRFQNLDEGRTNLDNALKSLSFRAFVEAMNGISPKTVCRKGKSTINASLNSTIKGHYRKPSRVRGREVGFIIDEAGELDLTTFELIGQTRTCLLSKVLYQEWPKTMGNNERGKVHDELV